MPRINLEDSLWDNEGFKCLQVKLGDFMATGVMVEAFKAAQSFWVDGKRPIPMAIWEARKFPNCILKFGLAEKRDGGVYVKGSEDQFRWLLASRENGKKGGRPKKSDHGSQSNDFKLQQEPTGIPELACPETSFLSSLSSKEEEKSRSPGAVTLHPLAALWNLHCGPKLAQVKKCGPARMKAAKARWKETPDEIWWTDCFKKVAASSFLTGAKASKDHANWRADFDWLMEPDKANRVMEGKYDNRGPEGRGPKRFFNSIDEAMSAG